MTNGFGQTAMCANCPRVIIRGGPTEPWVHAHSGSTECSNVAEPKENR